MDKDMPFEVETQAVEILKECRNRWAHGLPRPRDVEVRGEQDLFPWQIHDEHAGAMLELLDVYSSSDRVSSLRTSFSSTPSTLGFLCDFARTSPTSVRGEPNACSRKNLLVSSVRMVTPSATNGGSPAA